MLADISLAIQRMRLFNEKADKLLRCSFIQKVFKRDHGVTISVGATKPLKIERRGADEEATDALSLTLRFFLQPRDGISLTQMWELHQSLPIPEEEKKKAKQIAEAFQGFLDAQVGFCVNNEQLTNWNVLETILYGELAHVNEPKRKLVMKWRRSEALTAIINFHYEAAVAYTVEYIRACRATNERIMALLVDPT